MNRTITSLLLAAILSTASCVGGVNRLNEMPPMYDPVGPLNIRLVPYDPNRTERIYGLDGKPSQWGSILTGPYWTRVFSNDDSSGIVFELKLSKLEKGGGWAGQFQYYVEGTFRCDGKAQAVRENYRRSSAIKGPPAAFAVVVNDALIDLVEKGNTFAGKCAEKKSDLGPAPKRDKYTDLERLKNLLDDGAITQDEYDREKTKILNE